MPRAVTQETFNGGLDLSQNRSLIGPNRCHKAENVVFTKKSVKRRLGKRVSHRYASATTASVNALKRFYDLSSTGSLVKYFFKSISGGLLYRANTDWADATDYAATPITAWTNILMPGESANAENNLYSNYSSTQATCTLRNPFCSKSWCYWVSSVTAADNTLKTWQVPLRTGGTYSLSAGGTGPKTFLMGLVPPATLDAADIEGFNDVPSGSSWVGEQIDAAVPTQSGPGCLRLGADGRVHALYIRGGFPYYNVRSAGGVWGTPVQIAVATSTAYGSVSLDIDDGGSAHVSFVDTTASPNRQLYYSTNKSGSFVSEVAYTTGDVGAHNSIAIDASGKPHILFSDDSAGAEQLLHISRSASGIWSAATAVDSGAGYVFYPVAKFDSQGRLHVIYEKEPAAGSSLIRWAVRSSAGVWGAAATIDATGDDTKYPLGFDLNSSDNPAVVYNNATDTTLDYLEYSGSAWSAPVEVDANTQDSCDLAFDPDDTPHILYENNNSVKYNNRQGGTWGTAQDVIPLFTPLSVLGLEIGSDYSLHGGSTTTSTVMYASISRNLYHYRLTAVYDDGVLGESRPSDYVPVGYDDPVSGSFSHVIDLTSGTYDMTDDVTAIRVYRTISGGGASGTYYFVGQVDCTVSPGVPDSTFTDNVPDSELVANEILDLDKYMPPKFYTACIWKDRAVIANLKCRNTNATEGDLDSLDLGDGTQSSIHKNRLRFSDAFHPDIFRAGYFQDIIPDGDSGSITRVIVNPKIDALFVFMENDVVALLDPVGDLVSTLSFRPKNIANSKGTPASNSVVEYDGMLFYWTKRGIEVISGFEGRNITSKSIESLWRMLDSTHPAYADRINMARITSVYGHVDRKKERIYWAYAAGGTTYNNRILCFDYGLWRDKGYGEGVFSIFTGWDISVMETWDGEGDTGEFFGGESNTSDGPWVYRLNYGNFDENGDTQPLTTDTDVPISSSFYPGISPYGSERYKAFKSSAVEMVTGVTTVTVKLDVDNEKTLNTLAAVSWPDGSKAQRKNFGLPRTAIGVRSGLRFDVVDPAGGPAGWELMNVTTYMDDLTTRMRP